VTVRLITQAPLPKAQAQHQSRQQSTGPAAAAGASAFARTLCDPPPRLPSGKPQPGGVYIYLASLPFHACGPRLLLSSLMHTGGCVHDSWRFAQVLQLAERRQRRRCWTAIKLVANSTTMSWSKKSSASTHHHQMMLSWRPGPRPLVDPQQLQRSRQPRGVLQRFRTACLPVKQPLHLQARLSQAQRRRTPSLLQPQQRRPQADRMHPGGQSLHQHQIRQ
jgi:hypothetical protein